MKFPLWIIIVISFVFSLAYPAWWLSQFRAMDLPSYYVAGVLVREYANPYHPDLLVHKAQMIGLKYPIYPYIYFPMIAVIFISFSMLPYPIVQVLWFGITELFFIAGILILKKLVTAPGDCTPKTVSQKNMQWIMILIIVTLNWAALANFLNGQINSVIFFLFVGFLFACSQRKDIIAGILLAVLGMIKPQPLIVFAYLLYRKRFRCAVTTAITFGVGTFLTAWIVGWSHFMFYITEIMPTFNMVKTSFPPILIFAPPNFSLHGLIARLFQTTAYGPALINLPEFVPMMCRMATLLVFLVSAISIVRYRKNHDDREFAVDCAWLLTASLLVSPLTWDHHLLLLGIPGVYLMEEMRCSRKLKRIDCLLVFLWVILSVHFYPMSPIWRRHTAVGMIVMSLKPVTLFFFWILSGYRFFSTSASANQAVSSKKKS